MRLRDQFARWLLESGKNKFTLKEAINFDLSVNVIYKKLAIDTAINIIASTIIRAKFSTFEKGKETRNKSYYLFNVKPNQNQNATAFFKDVVSRLIYDNECLVVMVDKSLYIADYWDRDEKVFRENFYKDVYIGDLKLNRPFKESEVFYFKLNNENMKNTVDSLYNDYGKLIASSMGFFKKNNALRAVLNIDSKFDQTEEGQEAIEDLFDEQMKRFFEAEGGAVLPLQDGLSFTEVFTGNAGKRAGQDSRDIRSIIDDVFDFVATGFNIPKDLLKGDQINDSELIDRFLMFGVIPIAELIEDEINGKYYSEKEFLERTYMKIDTSMLSIIDIAKIANALDKMLSSATHNPNENRGMIDKEPIDEDWANKYYITKNYSETNEYLKESESSRQGSDEGGESE